MEPARTKKVSISINSPSHQKPHRLVPKLKMSVQVQRAGKLVLRVITRKTTLPAEPARTKKSRTP